MRQEDKYAKKAPAGISPQAPSCVCSVLYLFDLPNPIDPAQDHPDKAFAFINNNDFHGSYLPFP
jgi:hypothetical protein